MVSSFLLICYSFAPRVKVDNPATSKTILLDVVLHNMVVPMGVYTDIAILGKTEVHDALEDAASFWNAGNTMNNMVGKVIVYPLAIIYLGVGRLRGRQKRKVSHNTATIFNDIATTLINV
jgi:hypothetical protein